VRDARYRADLARTLRHREVENRRPSSDGLRRCTASRATKGVCGVSDGNIRQSGSWALTRGARGSDCLFRENGRCAPRKNGDIAVVDTVGAGDGYSAMLIAGLQSGWDAERLIRSCAAFARSICAIEGAIPVYDNFYSPFRELFGGTVP
jgi:sugar/nucleoside kinase (ribokinase family)